MVTLRAVENHVPIAKLPWALDVRAALAELYDGGDYWNRHKLRTEQYVHSDVDDIWLRFHEWDEDLTLEELNQPHESVWYPIAEELPGCVNIVLTVWRNTIEEFPDCDIEFGGVLITRVPPGKTVERHNDQGSWHAEHYSYKVGVQVLGHEDQAFCFDGYRSVALTGECYMFDNQVDHWIENNSDIDRITMIICMRVNRGRSN